MNDRTATAGHTLPSRLRFSLTAFAVMLIHRRTNRVLRAFGRFAPEDLARNVAPTRGATARARGQ